VFAVLPLLDPKGEYSGASPFTDSSIKISGFFDDLIKIATGACPYI
jgi:hypothetical protein